MQKVLIFASLLLYISGLRLRPSIFLPFGTTEQKELPISEEFKERFYEKQTIDHFSYTSSATYSQRYLEKIPAGWNQQKDPVFIYCGNEAEILSFYDNAGFLTQTLLTKFNARVLFLEHRYFGQSLPFGNNSYKYPNYAYLTVNQALADLVQFLRYYKEDILECGSKVCPKFIAFGGSYGGMLAAWLRMKFPNVIDGSVSSSGPILYFKDQVPEENFNKIATSDYSHSTEVPNCVDLIRKGYEKLYNYSLTPSLSSSTLATINSAFNLCSGYQLTSYQNISALLGWLETAHSFFQFVTPIQRIWQ